MNPNGPPFETTLETINIDSIRDLGVCGTTRIITGTHYGEIVSILQAQVCPGPTFNQNYYVIEPMGNSAIVASSSLAFTIGWTVPLPGDVIAVATVTAPSTASVTIALA